MKTLLLTFTGTCLIGGSVFYFSQKHPRMHDAPANASLSIAASQESAQPAQPSVSEPRFQEVPSKPRVNIASPSAPETAASAPAAKVSSSLPFQQMMQTLITPQASF